MPMRGGPRRPPGQSPLYRLTGRVAISGITSAVRDGGSDQLIARGCGDCWKIKPQLSVKER
jgi:hypothetical protein